jgi:hypothetical protein
METFTLDPRSWLIGRVFGRNPLLRRTDRIEALTTLVVLAVSLIAIPVAGVVGDEVYGARYHVYAQEAGARHTVMATVTDTSPTLGADSGTIVVQARWPVAAGERAGTFEHRAPVKLGDRIEMWVDKDGNPVRPPTPTWHAVGDAVGTAMAVLLILAVAMASLVTGVHSRLDRVRDAEWEREIRCLQEDGGRTNQH